MKRIKLPCHSTLLQKLSQPKHMNHYNKRWNISNAPSFSTRVPQFCSPILHSSYVINGQPQTRFNHKIQNSKNTIYDSPNRGRFFCTKQNGPDKSETENNNDSKQYSAEEIFELMQSKAISDSEYKELLKNFTAAQNKEPLTPLSEFLKSQIEMNGPLSVSKYMHEALLNPKYGYYTTQTVFGKSGDFVTSPEISSMFGEMIGIWVSQIQDALEISDSVRVVEFGPGKGTLASDIIRTIAKINKGNALKINYHLIEASPQMKSQQSKTLKCNIDPSSVENERLVKQGVIGQNGAKIFWNSNIDDVDGSDPVIVIAQEYFDALPVNIFEFHAGRGWSEVVVESDNSSTSPYHFRFSLSSSPSVNAIAAHNVIPLTGVQALPVDGTKVEISFNLVSQLELISSEIKKRNGAALIIDYGNNFSNGVTLRGIRDHKFQNAFSQPGQSDITCDVNFALIRNIVQKNHKDSLQVHGPIFQEELLKELGIHSRAISVLSNTNEPNSINSFITSYNRLLDHKEMGSVYKAIAISSLSSESFPGFS